MTDTLQDLRFKLQKRYARLQSAEPLSFAAELTRFWSFFDTVPQYVSVAEELLKTHPNVQTEIDALPNGRGELYGVTESESAAFGYEILRRVVAGSHSQGLDFMRYAGSYGGMAETLERFRSSYLEPFYEYLDEHLQERDLILSQLVRFKHLAEWFRREELWTVFKGAQRDGERRLAFKLYEYLYEQG